MGYIDKHLLAGETIIFQRKLTWTEYLKGLIVLLIGLLFVSARGLIGEALILFALLTLVLSYLKISTSEFAVIDKRVLIKVGFIQTRSLETMLNKIEGIHVKQGIIGKLSGSGSIVVIGTGGTKNPFSNIANPFEFRTAVNEQMSKR